MLVNLNALLPSAANASYAIPCFNVFGYEDARAVVEAAEEAKKSVILACNKDVIDFYGAQDAANLFKGLVERSSQRIVLHLDHTYEEEIIYQAIKAGFSSVMFDGSQLSLQENIDRTSKVAEVAHACDVSVEGEIGSVPYQEGRDHIKSALTDEFEAKRYSMQSNLDCMAVSVGNIHRLTEPSCEINFGLLDKIQSLVTKPLVIHGTSGIKEEDILVLKKTRVAKFNIGTSLRQALGNNLRDYMNKEPNKFDRLYFMKKVMPHVREEALRIINLLS